jgi:hypothetical protein
VAVGEERCGKLSPAPDAGLAGHGGQVLLGGAGGDAQLADDLIAPAALGPCTY